MGSRGSCDGVQKTVLRGSNEYGYKKGFVMEEIEGIKLSSVKYYNDTYWVSPLNFMSDIIDTQNLKGKVVIHDVTLRDGEQTPSVAWKEDERTRIALALNEIGIDRIEIGMPIISKSISRVAKKLVKMKLRSKIVPMARLTKKDIDLCIDTGAKDIIIEQTVNPYILKHVFTINPDQFLKKVVELVSYSKKSGLYTTFMGWDVFRNPLDYINRIYTAIAENAKPDSLVLTDTYGVTNPMAIHYVFKNLKKRIPHIPLEFHTHNDLGCATASALFSVMGGAEVVHTAMNGLGERAGNVPTEEMVAALKFMLGIETLVKPEGLYDVSKLVSELSKIEIPMNKPIIGRQIFQAESGGPVSTYQAFKKLGVRTAIFPFVPEVFGNDDIEILLGKGSGKESVAYYLDKLKLNANEKQIGKIVSIVKEEGRLRKASISQKEFKKIAEGVLGSRSK
jgi:isopropylmalate/homocitrate/citramalate synthase